MKGSPSAVAIAANVKKVMQDRGLSQEALAKLSGVSKSAIGYLINYRDGGDRHAALDTVDALSRALGIPPAQLIAEAPSVSGAKARTLHVVAEQGSPYKAQAPAHELDRDLLALVLEQAERLTALTAAQRAAIAVKVYEAVASDDRAPTAARVLRLLRSA